jgi:hypothetical protein
MAALISSLSPLTLTVSGGAQVVLATESVGLSLNIAGSLHHHSGNEFATLVVVPGSNPMATVSVPFESAFDALGLGINKLTELSLYLAKFVDFERVQAGAVKVSLTAACIATAEITDWSVSVDGILMATVTFHFLSSTGMLNPVTIGTGALPTIVGTPSLHTLGPVVLNGIGYPGLQASNGSMNAGPVVQRSDGDLFPRVAARIQAEPRISLTHADAASIVAGLGPLGASITGTCDVYFRHYDESTGVVEASDGIKIEITLGRVHYSGFDSTQGQVSSTEIEVLGITTDGGLNPLIVTTGITVPTA